MNASRSEPAEPVIVFRSGEAAEVSATAWAGEVLGGRVSEVLTELEERLFFLVRNGDGDVAWAFPVTVDRTPHRLTFSTGERLYAA